MKYNLFFGFKLITINFVSMLAIFVYDLIIEYKHRYLTWPNIAFSKCFTGNIIVLVSVEVLPVKNNITDSNAD